jgi:hypothetical protein
MKKLTTLGLNLAVAGALISGLCGCQNVKPWQRGILSDYTMRSDRDPIGEAQEDHIFFSREMASGGRGVGGGGCGCN